MLAAVELNGCVSDVDEDAVVVGEYVEVERSRGEEDEGLDQRVGLLQEPTPLWRWGLRFMQSLVYLLGALFVVPVSPALDKEEVDHLLHLLDLWLTPSCNVWCKNS